MPTLWLSLALAAQTLTSLHTLGLFLRAAPALRGYEPQARTAARYSRTAAQERRRTQWTQAVGIVVTGLSCVTAVYLVLSGWGSDSTTTSTTNTKIIRLCATGLNAAIVFPARRYVSDYWAGKLRIPLPGAGDYNDASRWTMQAVVQMRWLYLGWIVLGMLEVLA